MIIKNLIRVDSSVLGLETHGYFEDAETYLRWRRENSIGVKIVKIYRFDLNLESEFGFNLLDSGSCIYLNKEKWRKK